MSEKSLSEQGLETALRLLSEGKGEKAEEVFAAACVIEDTEAEIKEEQEDATT